MAMLLRWLALILCAAVAVAADAPRITPEQRAAFWRAQAEYIAASGQLQKAKGALDAAQVELAKACGGLPVVADSKGEPACKAQDKADK